MLSDDKLIDQIKYGNERAAEELITRYYASILRYCRWHCSSVEKAEDLTQEIFYKLFKNISGYQGKRKFKAYMPIQNIKLIAIAPMNMLQAEIYEYVFALLGAIGFAGVVMFISASMKNNVLALLFSLACVYGPMMIAEYLPYELQKVLDLLPLVGSGADIFRTNTFHIFGKYVWSPYLLVTVPILVGIFCMPFAVRNWSRRMKV